MLQIAILNGPNLNLLGEREPEIYGSTNLASIEQSCRDFATILNTNIDFFQTNHEGIMVDQIQKARKESAAIVINPAGFSFHSVPILDALKMFSGPIIEIHISNIHARDEAHRNSIMSNVSTGVICGLGAYGYIVAMQTAAKMIGEIPDIMPNPIRFGPI
jgi:3-dehydroquinate dehydratase-2|tara:strand:+ start:630 stop:1109 length:480 start_codon:yes stop_codon:yes gene_type:complete